MNAKVLSDEARAEFPQRRGTPVRVRDVGRVDVGGDIRRGLVDWNGEGEAVGAIIASPMIGGLVSLTLLTLIIIPVAYVAVRGMTFERARRAGGAVSQTAP